MQIQYLIWCAHQQWFSFEVWLDWNCVAFLQALGRNSWSEALRRLLWNSKWNLYLRCCFPHLSWMLCLPVCWLFCSDFYPAFLLNLWSCSFQTLVILFSWRSLGEQEKAVLLALKDKGLGGGTLLYTSGVEFRWNSENILCFVVFYLAKIQFMRCG